MAYQHHSIEEFIRAQFVEEEESEHQPTSQSISIRLQVQTVGDLEDLAGRLEMTRSMLARRLIEAGLEEGERVYTQITKRGKG